MQNFLEKLTGINFESKTKEKLTDAFVYVTSTALAAGLVAKTIVDGTPLVKSNILESYAQVHRPEVLVGSAFLIVASLAAARLNKLGESTEHSQENEQHNQSAQTL